MILPNWTPPLTKMRVFEALYLFNRSFEAAIHAVDQLERLEFFQNADLPTVHNRLEEIRSETNRALAENIHDYEEEESFRFGELVKQWERENRDDNELFFRSEEHKEKMRARLKELQEALDRQGPDRRISRRKARKRKPRKTQTSKTQTANTNSREKGKITAVPLLPSRPFLRDHQAARGGKKDHGLHLAMLYQYYTNSHLIRS